MVIGMARTETAATHFAAPFKRKAFYLVPCRSQSRDEWSASRQMEKASM